jgi:hypothetical protein
VSTAPSTDPTAPAPAFPEHPNWAAPQRLALGSAVVGLAVYGVAGGINLASAGSAHGHEATGQFFLSWTVGWVYWISITLGAMALLFIHYLAKTSWGLLLKKLLEGATRTLPLMAVLFIPVAATAFMKDYTPYWWVDPHESMITDEMKTAQEHYDQYLEQQAANQPAKLDPKDGSLVLQKRAVEHELHERKEGTFGYLTPAGFVGLTVVYFLIWGAFIFFLNKWGKAADDSPANVDATLEKGKNMSGPGLIVYALVGTSAATQWVMSFEPSWASTMFPVIYAVNQLLTALAFCVACFMTLVLSGPPVYAKVIRLKFKIDMGSFLLALTLFWSYTSFSQMMLVWIGNLPEEIPYYLKRSAGGWWWVSAFLIVFHFAFPFVVLLFRDIKGHPWRLRFMAIYILVVCAVDVVWWIEPTAKHEGQPLFWLMDVGAILGIGGVWGLFFIAQLKKRRLLPMNELYMLPEGHDDHGGHEHGEPAHSHEGGEHVHH